MSAQSGGGYSGGAAQRQPFGGGASGVGYPGQSQGTNGGWGNAYQNGMGNMGMGSYLNSSQVSRPIGAPSYGGNSLPGYMGPAGGTPVGGEVISVGPSDYSNPGPSGVSPVGPGSPGYGTPMGPGQAYQTAPGWNPMNTVTFDDTARYQQGQGMTATGQTQGANFANTGLIGGDRMPQTYEQRGAAMNAFQAQNDARLAGARQRVPTQQNPGLILHGDPFNPNRGRMGY